MLDRLVKSLTSLRLTVVLLCAALLLVFVGTLAQVHEGLYQAQTRYFKSWFVWRPTIGDHQWPILLPGGYLLGTLLLVNLLAAHATRFKFTKKKIGIVLVHAGVVSLLLGQLLTDAFSTESAMQLSEGEAKNYSQDFRANELVVIDTTDPQHDEVVAIPEHLVATGKEIRPEKLPFTLRMLSYWPNAALFGHPTNSSIPITATKGAGPGLHVVPLSPTVSMDERNVPGAIVEVVTPQGPLGSWLVSCELGAGQEFAYQNRTYQLALRFKRYYKPFYLKLEKFTHEKYRGTETPKNFASRVRIERPDTGENREVLIYMNTPLRYNGETYYQAGFSPKNDQLVHKVTILQVVRNPSWLTPYFSCALVALGLVVQFLTHLIGFTAKWRPA
jgi:hypothetical protein